jgi:chromosomal replication initiation ATPase DnaA
MDNEEGRQAVDPNVMATGGVKGAGYPTQDNPQSPRLSEVLFDQNAPSFANLAPFQYNVEALEAALIFAAGLSNFVAIIGPSGWGKSHILSAVRGKFKSEGRDCYPITLAARVAEDPSQFSAPLPLLLDDCQEVIDGGKSRAMLRLALENRVRAQRPTLLCFTGSKVTKQMRALLPQSRDWNCCVIENPAPGERVHVIEHMAKADGLVLSPRLAKIMAYEMHGNGRTIAGALKRLRLSGTLWQDNLSTVRACGLLNGFFSDNSSWDLKHRILKLIYDPRRNVNLNAQYPDLAAYVMLRVACLPEAEAARSLGVESAAAYFSASRFESELETNTPKSVVLGRLLEDLVRVLAKE